MLHSDIASYPNLWYYPRNKFEKQFHIKITSSTDNRRDIKIQVAATMTVWSHSK